MKKIGRSPKRKKPRRRRRKKKGGAKKTAPQARKKEIGNANRKSEFDITARSECAPVRLWRISRRDFAQNKFRFYSKHTAFFQNLKFRGNYERSKAPQTARFARKGLILQRFATLRVAKKKYFGFGFGSSFWRSQSKTKFCN